MLVVSDGVFEGSREDRAGPRLVNRLAEAGFAVGEPLICEDGVESVARALRDLADDFAGLVVTTGGTGFGPRDLTPEGTAQIVDRSAPGLAEAMRLTNPLGRLSRAAAGSVGGTLVLNLPGSPSGAIECLEAVLDVVPHALALLRGDKPH